MDKNEKHTMEDAHDHLEDMALGNLPHQFYLDEQIEERERMRAKDDMGLVKMAWRYFPDDIYNRTQKDYLLEELAYRLQDRAYNDLPLSKDAIAEAWESVGTTEAPDEKILRAIQRKTGGPNNED